MNWEQKLAALQALCPQTFDAVRLSMRKPGDWFVSLPHVEIKNGALLESCTATGRDPASAVENLWTRVTTLPTDRYLVVRAYTAGRKAVRWNWFMWADVQEAVEGARL